MGLFMLMLLWRLEFLALLPWLANATGTQNTLHDAVDRTVPGLPALLGDELDNRIALGEAYEPDFLGPGFDRTIIGRQSIIAPTAINNNVGTTVNITPELPQYFVFTNTSLHAVPEGPPKEVYAAKHQPQSIATEKIGRSATLNEDKDSLLLRRDNDFEDGHVLQKRENLTVELYITANTCLQPSVNASSSSTAPQLQLWISTTPANKNPGPFSTSGTTQVVFDNGFANYTLNATADVYVGVHASNTTQFTSGVYSVQIAASIDAPYHSYFFDVARPNPNLHLIDSDTISALLVTDNLTSSTDDPAYAAWMSLNPPPYDIFVFNVNNTAILGLSNSYCALKLLSDAQGLRTERSMTNITEGSLPKEQFYVTGLNGSSQYYGITVSRNTSASSTGAIGGGGSVWQSMTFGTMTDGTCSVIYNLSFCTTVAYAVPGGISQSFQNAGALAAWYDNYTSSYYNFFELAMQQIPCEIESSSQYSLAKTCDDCKAAYKAWLCSVSIPRCMDYSASLPWLQERNVLQAFPNNSHLPSPLMDAAKDVLWWNSSRNTMIDSVISPGPYKEILPCDDLCYGLIQSCPAALGFTCPLPGQIGFDHAYGQRPNETNKGDITCSFPGAVYGVSRSYKISPSMASIGITIFTVVFSF